jgi:hypothetical protein
MDKVYEIIRTSLTNNGFQQDQCCGSIEKAFRELQAYRRKPGNSTNLEYAAAEHYMFARWMTCTGTVNAPQMRAMTVGYDAKKVWDSLWGDPNKVATTANPVSKPDWDVTYYGLLGAIEGSADRKRCNPGVEPPIWKPVKDILPDKPLPLGVEKVGY